MHHKPIKSLSRKNMSHKGENGTVLIAAGGQDYVGAAALAGLSVLRSGSDLSIIIAPEKVAWAINCLTPDLITIKLKGEFFKKEHVKKVIDAAKKADALLIGNGVGLKSKEFVQEIIKKLKSKLKVIDADALKAIRLNDVKNSILTPHAKEFEIILKNNKKADLINRLKNASENKRIALIQEELSGFFSNNNVLLLKGHEDLIVSRTKVLINKTGNSGMSVGGTGDILAGLCAGYLSQTKDLFESAALAANNCGLIGDMLMHDARYGEYGFIASDFLQKIRPLKRKNSESKTRRKKSKNQKLKNQKSKKR